MWPQLTLHHGSQVPELLIISTESCATSRHGASYDVDERVWYRAPKLGWKILPDRQGFQGNGDLKETSHC